MPFDRADESLGPKQGRHVIVFVRLALYDCLLYIWQYVIVFCACGRSEKVFRRVILRYAASGEASGLTEEVYRPTSPV